jgi:hypothetical protein
MQRLLIKIVKFSGGFLGCVCIRIGYNFKYPRKRLPKGRQVASAQEKNFLSISSIQGKDCQRGGKLLLRRKKISYPMRRFLSRSKLYVVELDRSEIEVLEA